MVHASPSRCLASALLVLLSACATAGTRTPEPLPMAPTTPVPAPSAWERVRLASVSGPELQAWSGPVHPADALGAAIEARIGRDDSRPVVLRIEKVRSAVVGRPTSASPSAMTIGLGAEFVLAGPRGEKRLPLEHSLSLFDADERESGLAYAQLVDDLGDRLLEHPDALDFLGASQPGQPADSALARQPVPEVGPVVATESSSPDVGASGRILWGHVDNASDGFGNLMLGDTKGILAGMTTREANTSWGVGRSLSAGLGAVRMDAGTGSVTMMMVHLGVGLEMGLMKTVHDDDGYVLRPGVTLTLAPQMQVDMITGSMDVPKVTVSGTSVTQSTESATITTMMGSIGGTLAADIPLGSAFGIRAGYFVGMSFGTVKSSIGPDVSLPSSVVQYPMLDAYLQTSTGRTSLGLGFQALANAAKGNGQSFTKNPMLVFTFEERVGRGVAYSKSDVSLAGVGLHDATEVLSAPRSAFTGEGTADALTSDPGSALHTWAPAPGRAPPVAAKAAAETAAEEASAPHGSATEEDEGRR